MLSVIIPAYDEEDRLPATLRETLAFLDASTLSYEVIVVDDGSVDRTAELVAEIAQSAPALRLIRLAENSGKGFAVRSGFINAAGDRLLFMDADGATALEEIVNFVNVMTETGADIIIGSRVHLPGSHTKVEAKWFRHVAGRIFHQFVKLYGVSGIRDTQCGFKLFTRDAALSIASRMRIDGYSFDVEMLLIAREMGYRIHEVSVNWTHQQDSKVNVVADGARMVADLMRVRRNAMTGVYRFARAGAARVEKNLTSADAG